MSKKRELTKEEIEASNKTSIVIICISLFIIVVFCAYFLPNFFPNMNNKNTNTNNSVVRNTNPKILEGANMGPVLVSDVILEIDKGKSTYRANIKNNTDKEYHVDGIRITYFHDEQVLGTIEIMVNKTVVTNQKIEINAKSDIDFTTANGSKYEFIENN